MLPEHWTRVDFAALVKCNLAMDVTLVRVVWVRFPLRVARLARPIVTFDELGCTACALLLGHEAATSWLVNRRGARIRT